MFATLITIVLSVIGFSISLYLYYKKIKNEKVMCPIRMSCDQVIASQYGKFLGISVPVLGMFYYGFIFILTTLTIVFPLFYSQYIYFILFVASISSVIFSFYLSSVETFALKKWCIWCILSSIISFLIFVFIFIKVFVFIIPVIVSIKSFILIIHVLAVVAGLGGAILTDFFFFRFLDDKKITIEEARTMNIISEVIWFAVFVLVVTGFLLYLPQGETLNQSPRFITKVIGVAVLVLNGALLNFVVAPSLGEINFSTTMVKEKKKVLMRKLSFALGSISISSWLVVFILGYVKELNFSLNQFLSIYIFILFVSVLSSQLMDFIFSHHKENTFAK